MPLFAKVNGVQKEMTDCKVKVNGVWKQGAEMLVKINGKWEEVWRNVEKVIATYDGQDIHVPFNGIIESYDTISIIGARLTAYNSNGDIIGTAPMNSMWASAQYNPFAFYDETTGTYIGSVRTGTSTSGYVSMQFTFGENAETLVLEYVEMIKS